MKRFDCFYTEAIHRKGFKFQNGEIVLVSDKPDSQSSTRLNAQARPYINHIGVITGRIPRTMASPYYIVKFENEHEVPIIGLFLKGPYKSKEIAQKYQTNPNLKEDPDDLIFVRTPTPKKILSKYSKSYRLESYLKTNLPVFTWLDQEIVYTNDPPANVNWGLREKIINVMKGYVEPYYFVDKDICIVAYLSFKNLSEIGKERAT